MLPLWLWFAVALLPQQGTTYRVPAGTHLAIELQTSIDSEHAAVGDQVDGAVTTAIYSGETEVVPQGARVHGAVTEARPRTKRDAGRLVFSFTVLQHPATKSRIGIRTSAVTLEGRPAERHGLKTTPPTGAAARAGDRVDVTLLEPFLVLIPR